MIGDETARIERQIEWLKTASPEDWHRVALSFKARNDGPMDALRWIASQDDCDKATALTVFWKAEPQIILALMAEGQSSDDRLNRLNTARIVAHRLSEGGYDRSEIAFDPGLYGPAHYDAMVCSAATLDPAPMLLCDDMKRPIAGKPISVDTDFAKRYPPKFHNEAIRERYLVALQLAHLAKGTPDDWHVIAETWNWGDELDVLYWIVSQPDCDKATALTTFWKGEPTGYDYETEDEQMGANPYHVAPMLRYISERFNTSGYPRSEIAFKYHMAGGAAKAATLSPEQQRSIEELVERQRDLPDSKVKLHPDMMVASLPGRKVRSSNLYEAFPAYFDIDGLEIGSGPVMNFYGEPVSAVIPTANRMEDTAEPDVSMRVRAMQGQTEAKPDTSGPSGLAGWIRRLLGR